MKLFDILINISTSINDISGHEDFEKSYQPYIINRFLASSIGCVTYVEEMNRVTHLPKRLQYLYLLYSIKNKKRWFKYNKKETEVDKIIMKFFKCSESTAMTYNQFLNKDEIKKMKQILCVE